MERKKWEQERQEQEEEYERRLQGQKEREKREQEEREKRQEELERAISQAIANLESSREKRLKNCQVWYFVVSTFKTKILQSFFIHQHRTYFNLTFLDFLSNSNNLLSHNVVA